jgi:EAL domain
LTDRLAECDSASADCHQGGFCRVTKFDVRYADPARRALAAVLVTFATEIGATIIAEGIEIPGELAALQRLGIPWGQGYYLARPGPFPCPIVALPSSSRNLVERWFRELTDKAIRGGVFHCVPDLLASIEKYMQVHHDEPIWTATADSIRTTVRRRRVALGQAVSQ